MNIAHEEDPRGFLKVFTRELFWGTLSFVANLVLFAASIEIMVRFSTSPSLYDFMTWYVLAMGLALLWMYFASMHDSLMQVIYELRTLKRGRG